jgi:hypothetical protein
MPEEPETIRVQFREVPPPNGHQLVLDFIAAFASAQFWTDLVLERYLTQKMPTVGPLIVKQLSRTRDEDRVKIAHALAKEVAYTGPMTNFSRIYRRAADIRNRVAHHGVRWPMWNADSARDGSEDYYGIVGSGIPTMKKMDPFPIDGPVTEDTMRRLINDCNWLTSHLQRLLFEAGVVEMKDLSGDPYVPPVPPVTPVDGVPV